MHEKFKNKWYVRHDFNPEPMPKDWDIYHYSYMEQLGNCFDSREDAAAFSNKIRAMLNAPAVE
jgi:hypothetical protein